MLRDAAIRWVRTNCTSERFQGDFVRHLDEAIAASVNCSFVIGEGLTRMFQPYLLHWFAGELFIFQLTGAQAARLGIGPKATRYSRDHESVPDGAPRTVSISLEGLELDVPVLSDLKRPMAAKCHYRVTGDLPAACAFRMDFPQAANAGNRSFHIQVYPNSVPSNARAGIIDLRFEPLRLLPGMTLNAVMAVFVRCYAINSPSSQQPISNAAATTLELADDFRQIP